MSKQLHRRATAPQRREQPSVVRELAAVSALPGLQPMQRALEHHQSGRYREAQEIYAQILRRDPQHPDALHFSGLLAHQTGNSAVAVNLMLRSIQFDPTRGMFYLNLAQVFESIGETAKAIEYYRLAELNDPASEMPHRCLGRIFAAQGNFAEAAISYSRALAIKPDCAETISHLGSVLLSVGKLDASIVCFRKALSIDPNYAEAFSNLGTAFERTGNWKNAIESFGQAIRLKPTLAAAHANLGKVLLDHGDTSGALESLKRAIELQPDFTEALTNLGNAYRGMGLIGQSIATYRKAIEVDLRHASAHNNLGDILKDDDRIEEAVQAFQKAFELQPNYPIAYSNFLYLHAFIRDISPEAERTLAEGWEKRALTESERAAARKRAPAAAGVFAIRSGSDRQLHFGIVSAELGDHPVAEFLEPFLEQLDRKRFHLTLFPTCKREGARAERLQRLADDYTSLVQYGDAQAAEMIRTKHIDILMDTCGHSSGGGRLGVFAHRAAPVQFTYIGYWSTTGLTEMDWFIGDPYFDASLDAHFSEGIWRLPRSGNCYRGDTSLPMGKWQPDPSGTVWLGSFNKYGKIRRETLALWAKLLCAIPEAKLLLEDRAPIEDETHERILSELARHGVPACRVEFEPCIRGHERHMALYERLDIALDTIPFNSGTTAFDALWMGVPLVALEGNWGGGRMASAALKALGRAEWVANDVPSYVEIVRTLARNVDLRKTLRPKQRDLMAASPLCDAKRFAKDLEAALEGMYDCWVCGGRTATRSLRHAEVQS